ALPAGAPRRGSHRRRHRRPAIGRVGRGRKPPPRPEGDPGVVFGEDLKPRRISGGGDPMTPRTLLSLYDREPRLPSLADSALLLIDYQNDYLVGPLAL